MIMLICIFSIVLYSQEYKINEKLWEMTKVEYKYEDYSNMNKIEYYNKRIADVLKKYEHVLYSKDEYKESFKLDWIENAFKPALNDAIQDRTIFMEKKYDEKLNKKERNEKNN